MIHRRAGRLAVLLPFVVVAGGLAACEGDSNPAAPQAEAGVLPEAAAGDGGVIEEACAPATGPGTTHDKNVEASETWTAEGSPHTVTTTIGVRSGATLTIEPCAEVRLGPGISIDVASVPADATGALIAEGTSARPITFKRAGAEAWGHLFVRVPGGKATLRHVTLEGGGGDLETSHATLFVRGASAPPTARDVLVDHVTIKDSIGYGAVFDRAAGFAEGSTDLTIASSGKGDARFPFPLSVGEQGLGTVPTGTYAGNAVDEILLTEDPVSGTTGLQEDATLRDRGVPYRIGQNTHGQLRVEGATLTIEPGVTLRFEPDAGFVVHHQNEDAPAKAAVVAVGTAAKPIVFTSAKAAPAAGDWVGLSFGGLPLGTNRLDHVRIEYAGAACLCGGSTCSDIGGEHDAAIHIARQPATGFSVTNTTFSKIDGHGVHRAWVGATSPSFTATNTFTEVSGCPQTLPFPPGGSCPDPMPACE